MATLVGVGSSKLEDSFEAGKEAAQKAFDRMGLKEADFVLLFSSVKFDVSKMLTGIRAVTGPVSLVGCSSAGEITKEGYQTGSVVVMTMKSDRNKFIPSLVRNLSGNSWRGGEELAYNVVHEGLASACKAVVKKEGSQFFRINPLTFLIFPDGLIRDKTSLIQGVNNILSAGFTIIGGAAGDDYRFEKTYQFYNDEVLSGAVSSALIISDMPSGVGVSHGLEPVGPPMIVTKSEDNILYELNSRPALDVYCEYFGKDRQGLDVATLAARPLGIPEPEGGYRVRGSLQARSDGSIVFAADLPKETIVRFMKTDKEAMIQSAETAARQAVERTGNALIAAAIVFSCAGRAAILGEDTPREIEAIKKVVGEYVPLIGFYTYGEIGALSRGMTAFLNHTIVVYTITY